MVNRYPDKDMMVKRTYMTNITMGRIEDSVKKQEKGQKYQVGRLWFKTGVFSQIIPILKIYNAGCGNNDKTSEFQQPVLHKRETHQKVHKAVLNSFFPRSKLLAYSI